MKKIWISIVCVLLIAACVCGTVGCTITTRSSTLDQMDMLQKALQIIETNYIGDVDVDDLDYYAASAVLNNLDQFTYLSTTLYSQTSDSSIGLNILTTKYNEHIVTSVVEGFPAAETVDGFTLQRGDELYGISNSTLLDDEGNPIFYRLRGLSNSYLPQYTAGDVGTQLTLRIYRNGEDMGDHTYTKKQGYASRATLIPDVFGVDSGVGYISLKNFTYTQLPDGTIKSAADDFVECMKLFDFYRQDKLILDLRGNGGGSTDILSKIASYFVPLEADNTTEILQLKYAKSERVIHINVKEGNCRNNLPVVILCDEHTASAAEALIGACRAYHTANTTVIGTPTYGKGVFQRSDISLKDDTKDSAYTGIPDEYYVVMVSGYYYIIDPHVEGGMYNIHQNPILPDIAVTPNEVIGALVDDAEMVAARKVLLGE